MMSKLGASFAMWGLLFFALRDAAAELYVVQVGDGSASLTNASTAASILRFADSGGSPLSTINLPTTDSGANQPLTFSGTATSEGFIALSTNGQYLTLGGYGIAPGTATVAQTNSTVVNRVVGRIELSSETVDTSTALSDAYNANDSSTNSNIRSVASTDGTQFWSTGTAVNSAVESAGIRYSEFGATTSVQLSDAPTNTRVAKIFGDQLHVSAMSGAFRGISTVGTGLPTTGGQTTTLLPGFDPATNSPEDANDFWFRDNSTLYVADSRTVANGGGIQRWDLAGETWSLAYTLQLGTGSGFSARGLTGTVVDGNAILFATTTQNSANRLMSVTDTGAGSVAVELATAPTNTVFRGLAFVSSVAPPELIGDYNNNGVVDAADYVVWRDSLHSTIDLPNDPLGGTIGSAQYDQWVANFGNSGAGSALGASAVPEPAGVALWLVGALLVGWMRRVR